MSLRNLGRALLAAMIFSLAVATGRPAVSKDHDPANAKDHDARISEVIVDVENALIRVSGEAFGTKCRPLVLLGQDRTPLIVVSYTTAQIVVELPEVPDGNHLLRVAFPQRCRTTGVGAEGGQGSRGLKFYTYHLTIGEVGPRGLRGPQGPPGPPDPEVVRELCDLYLLTRNLPLPPICSTPLPCREQCEETFAQAQHRCVAGAQEGTLLCKAGQIKCEVFEGGSQADCAAAAADCRARVGATAAQCQRDADAARDQCLQQCP